MTRTFDVTRTDTISIVLTGDDLTEAEAIGETPEQFALALAEIVPLEAWDHGPAEVVA